MVYKCNNCGKQWYYPIEKCIFCHGDVESVAIKQTTVRGSTEIGITSPGHEKVPYYDLLLEDEGGNFHIRKSFTEYNPGDVIEE